MVKSMKKISKKCSRVKRTKKNNTNIRSKNNIKGGAKPEWLKSKARKEREAAEAAAEAAAQVAAQEAAEAAAEAEAEAAAKHKEYMDRLYSEQARRQELRPYILENQKARNRAWEGARDPEYVEVREKYAAEAAKKAAVEKQKRNEYLRQYEEEKKLREERERVVSEKERKARERHEELYRIQEKRKQEILGQKNRRRRNNIRAGKYTGTGRYKLDPGDPYEHGGYDRREDQQKYFQFLKDIQV